MKTIKHSGPICIIAMALTALLAPATAAASKEAVAFFPSDIGSVAVNWSGAGPADAGEIYVAGSNRIQRFATDDNGTPSEPYDDTYPMVAAWGAGVESGGTAYEICTVPASCKPAQATGGNGTAAGNGDLAEPEGIAVDQDSGEVYVADRGNHRINVYAGDGTFLRSFGWDVVQAGPGEAGSGYEVCATADGDVCKAGTLGAGVGQLSAAEGLAVSIPDGDPAAGVVYVADRGNHRIATFDLDGSSPASLGSAAQFEDGPFHLAVDSRGILYAEAGHQPSTWVIARYDTLNADGGGVGFLAPISIPPLRTSGGSQVNGGLQVDPDSDGPGPETDVLYALRGTNKESVVQQFGPLNPPGLTAPPAAADDVHGALIGFSNTGNGLGLNPENGRLFVPAIFTELGAPEPGTYVLDKAGGVPSVAIGSIDGITATSAHVHATVNPHGAPPVSYRLEYSTDGIDWSRTADVLLGSQETPQALDILLDPPGVGLEPGTLYHVRLAAVKAFTPPAVSSELTFSTLPAPPLVETVGAPLRTATTAELEGRVNPRNAATTYHFEYGEGPCDSAPCLSTAPQPAGAGGLIELVSQPVAGLTPGVTYHYRLVADNGNGTGPVFGADMTLTTRPDDAPLDHGSFPGPPESDRAWEQVSLADAGGNPVVGALSASDDGERVVYQISGGTPISDSGSGFSQLFSQRTPSGWVSSQIAPPRAAVSGPNWLTPFADDSLSHLTNLNFGATGAPSLWRLVPGGTASELFSGSAYAGFFAASDDSSRVVALLSGPVDPQHPVAAGSRQLYDVSDGGPRLASLMPGGQLPVCSVSQGSSTFDGSLPTNEAGRPTHWLSADGSLLFFPSPGSGSCASPNQLYMHDFAGGGTELISGPPVSGPSCAAGLVKATPNGVFFWTKSRLVAADTSPGTCAAGGSGDVYRFDLGSAGLECVTCLVEGLDAEVTVNGLLAGQSIAVAEDGSRLYFQSRNRLMPGAASPGTYRVDLADGDLAYVGPGVKVGDFVPELTAMSADGRVLMFASAGAGLNPRGGADNGGTLQYYRYDDRDRSLLCVSCPPDGSPAPRPAVDQLGLLLADNIGPNAVPVSADGGTLAFATPNALVAADQNSAGPGQSNFRGQDVYEWRAGRLLLISDGITDWPNEIAAPAVGMVGRSGRDVFFTASAQYTADALDGYNRLYDARIDGGIAMPAPPRPCPLEVCQGTPAGAPEEPSPGTASVAGAGNRTAGKKRRCPKGKVRRHGRCRAKPRHRHKHTHAHKQRHGGQGHRAALHRRFG